MSAEKVVFANSLRGIAALMVLAAHYCGTFWYSREAAASLTGLPLIPATVATPSGAAWLTLSILPLNLGPMGVALFFLISGFVIPFAFTRQTRAQFLIGRFFRLWPVYFVGFTTSVLIVIMASRSLGTNPPFELSYAALHSILGIRELLARPSIDGIVWTLEVELRFYLLAAVLAPLLARGSIFTITAPIALFLICVAFRSSLPMWFTIYAPYLIFMFIGVSLNFLHRGLQSLPVTITAIVILAMLAYLTPGVSSEVVKLTASNYIVAMAVFCTCMASSRRIPDLAALRFFAAISYPLYVLHALTGYAVMGWLVAHNVSPAIAISSATATAILLAWIIHKTIEMPSATIGRQIMLAEAR